MIAHVSVGMKDLEASRAFYARVLDPLGMKELVAREGTAGFGKIFPEFCSSQPLRRWGAVGTNRRGF